jgi:hypothetical protein
MGRLTMVLPEEGKNLTDYGLAPDGSGGIVWEDGTRVPSSVKYVHQKDEHLHRAIAKVLELPELAFQASRPE